MLRLVGLALVALAKPMLLLAVRVTFNAPLLALRDPSIVMSLLATTVSVLRVAFVFSNAPLKVKLLVDEAVEFNATVLGIVTLVVTPIVLATTVRPVVFQVLPDHIIRSLCNRMPPTVVLSVVPAKLMPVLVSATLAVPSMP